MNHNSWANCTLSAMLGATGPNQAAAVDSTVLKPTNSSMGPTSRCAREAR